MDTEQKSLRIELIEPLIVYRRAIAIAVATVMALVIAAKLIQPPSYIASAVVSSTPRTTSTPDPASRLGGLAGIAGLGLGNDQTSQNFDRFMYLTSSPELANWMIKNTDVLELYYPAWDSKKHDWREPEGALARLKRSLFGKPRIPDPYELGDILDARVAIKKIPSPDANKLISSIYLLTYTDKNPARAAAILRYILNGANEILRVQAQTRASRQATYLQGKLRTTPTQEYRETLMRLFSEQEQTLMLTGSHLPYAAEPIGDGAMAPHRAPRRTVMMALVSATVAFSLAYFVAIVGYNRKRRSQA